MVARKNLFQNLFKGKPKSVASSDSDFDSDIENTKLNELALSLGEEQLEQVLECDDFAKLQSVFGRDTPKIKNFFQEAAQKNAVIQKNKHFSFGQAVLNTLNENFLSFPKYFLGMITGFITLAFVPLSIMSGGLTLLGLGGGGLYLANAYQNAKKNNKKEDKARQFIYFKNLCADRLIDGLKNKGHKQGNAAIKPYLKDIKSVLNKPASRLPGMQKFFASSLMLTTLLFQSYYLAAHSLLLITGLSLAAGAMIGPIGLGIATGVIAGISLFLSYKQYRANREKDKLSRYKNALASNLTQKKNFYKAEKAKLEKEHKNDAKQQENKNEHKNEHAKPKAINGLRIRHRRAEQNLVGNIAKNVAKANPLLKKDDATQTVELDPIERSGQGQLAEQKVINASQGQGSNVIVGKTADNDDVIAAKATKDDAVNSTIHSLFQQAKQVAPAESQPTTGPTADSVESKVDQQSKPASSLLSR